MLGLKLNHVSKRGHWSNAEVHHVHYRCARVSTQCDLFVTLAYSRGHANPRGIIIEFIVRLWVNNVWSGKKPYKFIVHTCSCHCVLRNYLSDWKYVGCVTYFILYSFDAVLDFSNMYAFRLDVNVVFPMSPPYELFRMICYWSDGAIPNQRRYPRNLVAIMVEYVLSPLANVHHKLTATVWTGLIIVHPCNTHYNLWTYIKRNRKNNVFLFRCQSNFIPPWCANLSDNWVTNIWQIHACDACKGQPNWYYQFINGMDQCPDIASSHRKIDDSRKNLNALPLPSPVDIPCKEGWPLTPHQSPRTSRIYWQESYERHVLI